MTGPLRALLPDRRRVHFQHGPIDLVIEAIGRAGEVGRAYDQAWDRFRDILPGLAAELALLRRPLYGAKPSPKGAVARRMVGAAWPHRRVYVTPMAAVAGAVADEVLAALVAGRALARAYVNDGGDIALYLAPGESFEVGVVSRVDMPAIDGRATIAWETPVRGIATSGRSGRSLSRGIADSVTVLARDAAAADAAATLVANAVDLDHEAVRRAPASELDPDSDLGGIMVTTEIGPLDDAAVAAALEAGRAAAERMAASGLIHGAMLALRGRNRFVGEAPGSSQSSAPRVSRRRSPSTACAAPV